MREEGECLRLAELTATGPPLQACCHSYVALATSAADEAVGTRALFAHGLVSHTTHLNALGHCENLLFARGRRGREA